MKKNYQEIPVSFFGFPTSIHHSFSIYSDLSGVFLMDSSKFLMLLPILIVFISTHHTVYKYFTNSY